MGAAMPLNAIVTRIERRRDNAACRAYVCVAVPDLGIEVQGVRIIERANGSLYAQLPNQRDHRGQWFPAVRFTDPAVSAAVLNAALGAWGLP